MQQIQDVSWQQVEEAVLKIKEGLNEFPYNSKVTRPNRVIAISKGGLIPGRLFCDIFNIDDIEIVNAKYYIKGTSQRLQAPMIQLNGISQINKDDYVLLVDEIIDTGRTLAGVYNLLESNFVRKPIDGLQGIITCVALCSKLTNPSEMLGIPRVRFGWYDQSWLVFPWDRNEFKRSKSDELMK